MLTRLRDRRRADRAAYVLRAVQRWSGVTALFLIVAGGVAFAATQLEKNSVKSKHIKNGQVKNRDLATNAVDTAKVADGSLLGADFAAGQLPRGEQGPPGSPDTPQQVLDKLKSVDGSGSGSDADLLDNLDSAAFVDILDGGTATDTYGEIPAGECGLNGRLTDAPAGKLVVASLAADSPASLVTTGLTTAVETPPMGGPVVLAQWKVCNVGSAAVPSPNSLTTPWAVLDQD